MIYTGKWSDMDWKSPIFRGFTMFHNVFLPSFRGVNWTGIPQRWSDLRWKEDLTSSRGGEEEGGLPGSR